MHEVGVFLPDVANDQFVDRTWFVKIFVGDEIDE